MTFGPYPRDPLPFPSIVIASRNDPFCDFDVAEDIAAAWGSLFIDAGQAGHLNSESGYGPWALTAGYLRNSYDKHSVYGGVRWTPLAAGPFRFGLYGLAASGYPSPILVLPVITVEGRNIGANLIAVPNLPGYSGYLGLQLRFALP